jgi:hypothetical protein
MEASFTERALARQVQARQIEAQARQQEALEVARVMAAYRHLAQNADFLLLRQYWIERYLLQPITTEQQMGQHNAIVQILADMRSAGAVEHLREGETW